MTEAHILKGKIVHGKSLGRTVGMPTANLQLDRNHVLPEKGVYATYIYVDGKAYPSVTNIGTRPSVDADAKTTIETYILNFNADIYGKKVELEIVEFLRPIQKFGDLEQVREQVEKDVENAKNILTWKKQSNII